MLMISSPLFSLFLITAVYAAPVENLDRRSVRTLTAPELTAFAPYTEFVRAAYCPTSKLQQWACGDACDSLPGFKPSLVGGDGSDIPDFFVGYWGEQNSVVVSHEGTDPTKFLSVLIDIDLAPSALSIDLFPGISSNVKVHHGFRDAHAETAEAILAEVKKLMAQHNSTNIVLTGHSLGGAIAELDSVFFSTNLPSDISISVFTFGSPRVGNSDFASLVNSNVKSYKRINNKKDPIPILPGRHLGFAHPEGEIHLLGDSKAVECSGQDDADDAQCQIKTVANILAGNIFDHLGPYEGLSIGTFDCLS